MRTTIYGSFIVTLSLGSFTSALAQNNSQNKESNDAYRQLGRQDYEKFLSGKTIKGEYRFMRERSKTFRFEEHHNTDGTTDYKEGSIRSKGLWFILGEHKICYKYPNDSEMFAGTSCFWVYKADKCYYGYNLGAMTLRGPRNFSNWGARWIIKGDGGSCAPSLS
ncbi:MAG: hypothetical protein V3U57_03560 [Robiginitomaculum sp.]